MLIHTNNRTESKTTSLLSLGRTGIQIPSSCNFTWLQLLWGYQPGSLERVLQSSSQSSPRGPYGCAVNWSGRWPCTHGTTSCFSTLLRFGFVLWFGTQPAKPLPSSMYWVDLGRKGLGWWEVTSWFREGSSLPCLKANFWIAAWGYGSWNSYFPLPGSLKGTVQIGQGAGGQELCLQYLQVSAAQLA